jgi:hypothetical protein
VPRDPTPEERSQNAAAAAQHIHKMSGAEYVVVLLTGPPGEARPVLMVGAWAPPEIIRDMLREALLGIEGAKECKVVDWRGGGD